MTAHKTVCNLFNVFDYLAYVKEITNYRLSKLRVVRNISLIKYRFEKYIITYLEILSFKLYCSGLQHLRIGVITSWSS